jgi:hypothetical protein
MKNRKSRETCVCNSCSPPIIGKKKELIVDFLYIDLEQCDRCQATNSAIDEALSDLSPVLESAGASVTVNRILIKSPHEAERYSFLSSPTIRVNGLDVAWHAAS